ncbi:MAG: nucleotidyltransferase family protein [Clostridiales bacterium]|nr:nucleotidyltransferase family protein [Clostridiales bacterium]
MKTIGIIAEYNPLHNGHIYHMEESRRLTGADLCVVAMSGNFVQRGELACADKYTRAEWALQAGATLVLEIPAVHALAPAEQFAAGAVRALANTGLVTHLPFGCECDNLQLLQYLADISDNESPQYKELLAKHLAQGKAYPRARTDAFAEMGLDRYYLSELEKPNNILAIEYLRALKKYAPQIRPVPVLRRGSAHHDAALRGAISSGSAIREALRCGDEAALDSVPLFVGGALRFNNAMVTAERTVEAMILYKLRTMEKEELAALPGAGEGIENVIFRAARDCANLAAFYETVKSKRYTMARIKRMACCALLGISADLTRDMALASNDYVKVLGIQSRARNLLSGMATACPVPVIARNSDLRKIDKHPASVHSFAADTLTTDLLGYAQGVKLHRDTEGIVIV